MKLTEAVAGVVEPAVALAAFLVSDGARHMTGNVILVDSRQHMAV